MRYLALFILVLLALGQVSCGITEPEDTAYVEINAILYDLTMHFNNDKDIEALMSAVHPDYQHNGMNAWALRQEWQARLAEYYLLEMRDIVITVNGDLATVSMRLDLISESSTQQYNEPLDNGSLSYFCYDDGSWQICGEDYIYQGCK